MISGPPLSSFSSIISEGLLFCGRSSREPVNLFFVAEFFNLKASLRLEALFVRSTGVPDPDSSPSACLLFDLILLYISRNKEIKTDKKRKQEKKRKKRKKRRNKVNLPF